MIENFKEIAAKILNHEIQGVFTLNCGNQYPSHHLTLETDAFDRKTMFYSLDHNTYDLNGCILNCGKEPDSPWAITSFTEFDEKPEPIAEEEKPINTKKGISTFILTLHKGYNGHKMCDDVQTRFGNVNTARGNMLTEYFNVADRLDSDWSVDTQLLDGPNNAIINIHNLKTGDFYSYIWTIREIKL